MTESRGFAAKKSRCLSINRQKRLSQISHQSPERDAEYTRELGDAVLRLFAQNNVVMSTHLVARSLFHLLRRSNPGLDLFRLLRTGGAVGSFPMSEVHAEVSRLLELLRQRTDGPKMGRLLCDGDVQEIVGNALRHFGIFHTRPAAVRQGDRVFHEHRNRLLYYGNRLSGYGLDADGDADPAPTVR